MATGRPPPLHKPPGFRDPNAPPPAVANRSIPRKPPLPPSFKPPKRRGSCCRRCYCCCCLFLLILILLLIIFGVIFFFWFNPKIPNFNVKSFKITKLNITDKPEGKFLDATTETSIDVKNPNEKIKIYYGATTVDVTVGEGGDETDLGKANLGEFSQGKMNTTSLKVETTAGNQAVGGGTGEKLLDQFKSKNLAVNVDVKTKLGVGLGGVKFGMFEVRVKCSSNLKDLEGNSTPKCNLKMLNWVNIKT